MKKGTGQLSNSLVKKIMEIQGKGRGVAIKSHADFIVKEEGEEALERLETKMRSLGAPVSYRQIKKMDFYPVGLEVVTLLAAKELFGFDREKIKEMGSFESKTSLLVRIFMKYFVSIKNAADQVSAMWGKNYTIGDLNVKELNNQEKYVKLKLEDFALHPIHCLTLLGYFKAVVKMIVNSDQVISKEINCIHQGDDYHEFLIQW